MSSDVRIHRAQGPSALPPGTELGEFKVLSVLGVGGFGIVYLAFDKSLEREVAVKEYMPASLAGRTETMHVSVRSNSDQETFDLGRKSFVNEAKLLARFDHPSLLKVLRFWEANDTAYMAMPVMRGRTVKDVRAEMAEPPSELWLRELLDPLLGAIDKLHSEGVYHRDIAPDNIQIEPDGHPVLLDFGAARRVISDKSQTLTAILKPAYAPIEQYAEVGSVKQGPWTDIYALGATLHFLLLGRPPAPATARAVHDEPSALTVDSVPGSSANFLHIVDWMLAPRPADRPQSVAALREVLSGQLLPPQRRNAEPAPSQWDRTVLVPHAPSAAVEIPLEFEDQATVVMPKASRPGVEAVAPALPPPAALQALPEPALMAPPVAGSLDAPPASVGKSRLLPVALGLGAVVVALATLALWPRSPAAPTAAGAAASAAAVAAAASAAELPPLPARPESSITTVVLQEAPRTAVAEARPTAKPTGAERARAEREAQAAAAAALAATPAPAMEAPKPHVEVAAPAPVVPTPVAAAPAPAPEPPKPVATGPEARCSGKNPAEFFICMELECLPWKPGAKHADCQKWHKDAKRE